MAFVNQAWGCTANIAKSVMTPYKIQSLVCEWVDFPKFESKLVFVKDASLYFTNRDHERRDCNHECDARGRAQRDE